MPGDQDTAEAELIRGEIRIERELSPTHRVVRFAVGASHGRGWRLDKYLTAVWPTISRSLILRWLERGAATVDGRPAEPRMKLRPGMRVEVHAPLPERDPGDGDPPPLEILHHDRAVLVCNKPVGQLAHQAGRTMSGTLIDQAQDWWAAQGGRREDVRLVNRIDRDTSGIVLLSLEVKAHARMAAAMEAGDLHKEYRAICHRLPRPPAGAWRDPIGEAGAHTIARAVRADGQEAWTDYELLEQAPGGAFSLLRLLLHTGRQHQIRVHASHHGLPLVGDWVYGSACAELPGQALHAAVLALPHPLTGRELRIEAPLTASLRALWRHLAAGGAPTPLPLTAEQRSKLGLKDAPRIIRPSWLSEEEFRELEQEAAGHPDGGTTPSRRTPLFPPLHQR